MQESKEQEAGGGGLILYSFNPRMLPDDCHPKPLYRKLIPRIEEELFHKSGKKRKSKSADNSPKGDDDDDMDKPTKKRKKAKSKQEDLSDEG